MSEVPALRWFDAIPKCWQCGKDAHGRLMGPQNQYYGWHCRRCAEKRLRASEKARSATPTPPNTGAR